MSDEIFSSKLRTAMLSSGLTQAELGSRAGIAQGAISNYLRGKRYPASQELLRIARALNVTMEWLLTGEGPAPPGPAPVAGNLKEAARSAEALARKLREAEGELTRLRGFLP